VPFDLARYRALLRSTGVGADVRYIERTASTMDDARLGADEGGGCGTAYVGGEQTAGRGRQGRSWVSAASAGLYVTYHLCVPDAEHAPVLGIAGALAASDAIRAASGVATQLKWPNDVLHDGRKLCGVLAESRVSEVPGRGLDVFLGIGINIRASGSLPPEVAAIATSIEDGGASPPDTETLLAALSDALDGYARTARTEPGVVVGEWRERLTTLGQRIRLNTPSGVVEGDAVDVTSRGELVLRLGDGTRQSFAAGDVTALR
jgi:BirA family biotin operon repressor/biotin-[acetyl-CoA-carboxylase] ligase